MSRHDALRVARAAHAADDEQTAVSALLEAWRAAPHPRIASVLVDASRRAHAGREPWAGSLSKRYRRALEALESSDPLELEGVLDAVEGMHSNGKVLATRMFGVFTHDPRVAHRVVRWMANPWTNHAAKFWRHLGRLLKDNAESSAVEQFLALDAMALPVLGLATRRAIVAGQRAWTRKVPPDVELDEAEAGLVDELEALLGVRRSAASALSSMEGQPIDSEEARWVLHDALKQDSNPMGDVLAACLKGDANRGLGLFSQHRRAILGPVADHLDLAADRLEDGMLVGLRLLPSFWAMWEPLAGVLYDRVREVDLGAPLSTGSRRLQALSGLPSLRRIDGVSCWEEVASAVAAGATEVRWQTPTPGLRLAWTVEDFAGLEKLWLHPDVVDANQAQSLPRVALEELAVWSRPFVVGDTRWQLTPYDAAAYLQQLRRLVAASAYEVRCAKAGRDGFWARWVDGEISHGGGQIPGVFAGMLAALADPPLLT